MDIQCVLLLLQSCHVGGAAYNLINKRGSVTRPAANPLFRIQIRNKCGRIWRVHGPADDTPVRPALPSGYRRPKLKTKKTRTPRPPTCFAIAEYLSACSVSSKALAHLLTLTIIAARPLPQKKFWKRRVSLLSRNGTMRWCALQQAGGSTDGERTVVDSRRVLAG